MKRFLMIPVLLAAFVLASGTGWAFNYADHVSQAPGGKGDLLVYPIYDTTNGFSTKIQVINTSLEMSAVAKVVVRTARYSQEVLDFFIFLSPGDVWEGFLRPTAAPDRSEMYSEDGSTLISVNPIAFASTANPFRVNLLVDPCDPDHSMGYVEMFLAYVMPGDTPGTSKASIANRFIGAGTIRDPAPIPGSGFHPGEFDALGLNTNILAGHLELRAPLLGDTATLNATVLKDYRLSGQVGLGETIIGQVARNSVTEVEAAISKNYIGMPYVFNFNNEERYTSHGFTFPFKNVRFGNNCAWNGGNGTYTGYANGVSYEMIPFDMEENTRFPGSPVISPIPPTPEFIMPYELNLIMAEAGEANPFSKGWYRYSLFDGPTSGSTFNGEPLTYTGAPVIPFVLDWTYNAGLDSWFISLSYGNWTDGTVSGATGILPGYQYIRSN